MLKQRALSATVWSAIEIFSRQGVQFAIAIALARLLTPVEFGTFGLILLFTGIATVFVDGGFSAALIQRRDVSQTDESTVFWFNLFAGVLTALTLLVVAPAIASFYAQPILSPVLAVMALNILLGALGAIHASLLSKQLDFRTQAKVGFIAAIVSGVVSVWMAWTGFGIWALVAQTLAMTATSTMLFWVLGTWRPTLEFSRNSVRKLFGFGGYHFASTLLDMAYSKLYTVPIGKFDGVRALGYYSNADSTQQMPGGVLMKILARVAFPMFAMSSGDPEKLRRGMQLGIRGAMLINIPVMLGMAVVAKPMTQVLFGGQWLPAVPILQILCLSGVLLPVHVLNLNCLMALGYSRLMFRVEVAKKLLGVVLLGAAALFGITGIAWAMVVLSISGMAINTYYTKRLLDYGLVDQTREFFGILLVGIVMAIAVAVLSVFWTAQPAAKLAGLVAAGAVIFSTIVVALRMDALSDIAALFRQTSAVPPATMALP